MKKDEIAIEYKLFSNINELVLQEDDTITATIVDAELDPIDCVLHGDNAVEINTKNLSYIVLTEQNLKTLLKLISKAKEFDYKK